MPLPHRIVLLMLVVLITAACAGQPTSIPTSAPAQPTTALPATTAPATVAPATVAPATVAPAPVATGKPVVAGSPTAAPPPFARIELAPLTTTLPAAFQANPASGFANFQLPAVNTSGRLAPTSTPANLNGVVLPFLLAPAQRELIGRQGFVVSPSASSKFYEVYERNRYDYLPSFITTDSILHGYHQAFDGVLRQTEMAAFAPTLVQLNHAMLTMSANYYEQLAGTSWQEAARRNVAYFAVPVALLEPTWPVPPQVADIVQTELQQVRAHAGQHPSPLFPDDPRGEDYSQYTPRGHYTRNETLSRYFQAMMWHGRRSFSAADYGTGAGPQIVRQQEVLMVQALREARTQQATALDMWQAIYEPTSFFVGETDGLTPPEVFPVLDQVYGSASDIRQVADDTKLAAVSEALASRRAERIQDIASGAGPAVVPGLRFMGARLVPDAAIYNDLVHPQVPGRMVPTALDVFAVLGSDRALAHLNTAGATKMPNYNQNLAALQNEFGALDDATWASSVYLSWLNTLRPLLGATPAGYPGFMQSDAWRDRQLHTALGSYAELKHDTLLYAKQFAAEAGFALEPPTPDLPRGYVEPAPLVYARIVALSDMTRRGLSERGLLSDYSRDVLDQVIALASQLQALAEKELRGEALSEDEARWIFRYGMELEYLTRQAERDPSFAEGEVSEPPQAAIVADIATTSEGVVHVADGKIFHILVAVPVDGKMTVMRGGVYSFYEFIEPNRLTDEAWRERLDRGAAPARPEWTASFEVNETLAAVLTQRILQFNDAITAAFWYRNPASASITRSETVKDFLVGAELDDTLKYIQQLTAQKQFLGLKRLAFEFRSYDVAGDSVTVATREQWDERLYSGSSEEYNEVPAPVRQRSYTADVTYTLVQQNNQWMISKIVINELP